MNEALTVTIAAGTVVLVVLAAFPLVRRRKKTTADPPPADLPSGSNIGTRIAYDIADGGQVETYDARIRNQDVAFKVRGSGKLRDEGTDIG